MHSPPTALEIFQSSHQNHLGLPLKVDNLAGAETLWAQAFVGLHPERRFRLKRALTFRGLAEDPPGSNDERTGTIDRWLKLCHAPEGEPWCASGACEFLQLPGIRIAGALRLLAAFPMTDDPIPLDIGGFPTGGGKGHVFVILGADADEVMTLECNADNAVRVWRRPRQGLIFARTPFPILTTAGHYPGVVKNKTVPLVKLALAGTR
jgi:hypothetical protein